MCDFVSSSFRDVYSPDSNDSGILTDDRGRVCRRRSRGNCAIGRGDATTGSESTPEKVDEIERRELSTVWDQPVSVIGRCWLENVERLSQSLF